MDSNELSFEEALARLEDVVGLLESGELPVEELVSQFEQGTTLVQRCRLMLDTAQARVSRLVRELDLDPVTSVLLEVDEEL
ncbi:MAG TPA: exodeoxyribonuclease VII small subunit [Chloroflexota bacterium]|jgi:exodeoxyribonuclease VII small subunit